jgi:hypothetical protein
VKFKLEISCDNAAFHTEGDEGDDTETEEEVARILRAVIKRLQGGGLEALDGEECVLMDVNGNKVGKAEFVEDVQLLEEKLRCSNCLHEATVVDSRGFGACCKDPS